MAKAKTWWDFHEEIESLKEKRIAAWREQMPDHVNDHAADDEVASLRSQRAVRTAERHPDVRAIDDEIAALRDEQLANHNEPTAEEWQDYYAAQAGKE